MGRLSEDVQRLRTEFRLMAVAGRLVVEDVGALKDRVAQVLLAALSDEQHPLRAAWERLRGFVADWAAAPPAEGSPPPDRPIDPNAILFMPQPGMGNAALREHWPLQLLLRTAASSPTRAGRVARFLEMSPEAMREAVRAADACGSHQYWPPHEYAARLESVLAVVEHADAPLDFEIEGRMVRAGDGTTVRIGPHQAILLQALVDHVDRPVTFNDLRELGVANPVKIKGAMMRKLREAGIEPRISGSTEYYQLSSRRP